MLVKKAQVVPLEAIVRGYLTGTFTFHPRSRPSLTLIAFQDQPGRSIRPLARFTASQCHRAFWSRSACPNPSSRHPPKRNRASTTKTYRLNKVCPSRSDFSSHVTIDALPHLQPQRSSAQIYTPRSPPRPSSSTTKPPRTPRRAASSSPTRNSNSGSSRPRPRPLGSSSSSSTSSSRPIPLATGRWRATPPGEASRASTSSSSETGSRVPDSRRASKRGKRAKDGRSMTALLKAQGGDMSTLSVC